MEPTCRSICFWTCKMRDDLADDIPAQMADVALPVIIGALMAWAELTLRLARAHSVRMVESIAQGDSTITELIYSASDVIGINLAKGPPKERIPKFASLLMQMLGLQANAMVHFQIGLNLIAFADS